MDKLWYLRRIDLLEGLSEMHLQKLAELFRNRTCRVGEDIVVRPSGDRVYLLKAGRVRVMRAGVAVAALGPGQLFGTSALFGAAATDQRVVAIEDVVICDAPVAQFLQAMATHPTLAIRVMRTMARQVFDLEQSVERASREDVEGRLAALLLREARSRDGGRAVTDVSQSDLARLIGASRESVWRVLTRWERAGMVRVEHRAVLLLDESRLRSAAAGT